jgi:hypothetical protein
MGNILKDLSGINLIRKLGSLGDDSKKISELQSQNDSFKKQLDGMQRSQNLQAGQTPQTPGMKKGGMVKKPIKKEDNMMSAKKKPMTMGKKPMAGMKPSKLDMFNNMKKGGSPRQMSFGGKEDMAQDKAVVKKAVGMHDKQMHGGKKTDLATLKKGGMPMKKMASGGLTAKHKSADGIATQGKTRAMMPKMNGRVRKFAEGGSTDPYEGMSAAQKKWLGGADPTDPYILDRMRRNVPDEVKATPKMEEKSSKYVPFEENFEPTEGLNEVKKSPTARKPVVRTVPQKTEITEAQRKNLKGRDNVDDITPGYYDDMKDQNDRRRSPVKAERAPMFTKEAGNQMKEDQDAALRKLKNTSAEDVAGAAMSLLPIGRAAGLLKKGVGALKNYPQPRIGYNRPPRLGMDKKDAPLLGYDKNPKGPPPKSIKETSKKQKEEDQINQAYQEAAYGAMKKGGKVKTFKQGGSVSASSRGDGIATKGRTRGKFC